MAAIPDAKIIVRIDTAQAQKELDALKKGAAKPGAGDKAALGGSKQKTIPSQRMATDDETETREPTSRAGMFEAAKKANQFRKKAQRVVTVVDKAFTAAFVTSAGAAAGAEMIGAPDMVVNVLKANVESILMQQDWFKNNVLGRIAAVQQAIQDVREAAVAMQLGGDTADVNLLKSVADVSYVQAKIETMRRASMDRHGRATVPAVLPELLKGASEGWTGGSTP